MSNPPTPDELLARYEAVAYHAGPVRDSHPARLGAIARLHGLAAAAPEACRVLELGCGAGENLLPLAERFPRSEFHGVDFAASAIAEAENARAACGLENVRLLCADLREFEPEPGGYDYVIAHGVYSWVPPEVRDRLLAISARALALNGVAYVSYSTLPGWGLIGGLREFLRAEIGGGDLPAQAERAHRLLGTLGHALSEAQDPYSVHLRQTIGELLRKPPGLLLHDELAPVSSPCTFAQFTDHAAAHDLHYLAEARYATMHLEHAPAPMRAALAGLNLDFRARQQYLDVLFQRWLRNSLLSRQAQPPEPAISLPAMRDCAIGLRLEVEGDACNLAPGAPVHFSGPNGVALDLADPAEKALLAVLIEAAPRRVPFPEALAAANTMLGRHALPLIHEAAPLGALLYRLFALDALDLALTGDGAWLQTSPAPAPSPLMRYAARHGLTVANRWHEPIALTEDGRRWATAPSPSANDGALNAGLLV
jgi:SAM-dependent methyltransferase